MSSIFSLTDLRNGQKAIIRSIEVNGLNRRRFFDLGFIPGTEVRLAFKSPLADPIAYNIRGTVIAIRNEEAKNIKIEIISEINK